LTDYELHGGSRIEIIGELIESATIAIGFVDFLDREKERDRERERYREKGRGKENRGAIKTSLRCAAGNFPFLRSWIFSYGVINANAMDTCIRYPYRYERVSGFHET